MRRRVTALLVVALAATLAACGSGDSSLPDASTIGSSTPTATDGWDAEQRAVIRGFARYNRVLDAVARGGKLKMTKVRKVAREPYATRAAKKADATASAGVLLRGAGARFTPSSVEVDGTTATYEGCADYSDVRLVNTYADPPADVPIEPATVAVRVQLARSGHAWLVTGIKRGGPCAAGAS